MIISHEVNEVSGKVKIKIICHIKQKLHFTSEPTITLPKGWTYKQANVNGLSFNSGDSVIMSFDIFYKADALPFFPQTIKYVQGIVTSENNQTQNIQTEGKLYFTPYNTVEIWNNADFYNIPRMWLDDASKIDTTRISISKMDIPTTNLSRDDIVKEEWQENWTAQEVKGLAYQIPMKMQNLKSVEMLITKLDFSI